MEKSSEQTMKSTVDPNFIEELCRRLIEERTYRNIREYDLRDLAYRVYNEIAIEVGFKEHYSKELVDRINAFLEEYKIGKIFHVNEDGTITFDPKVFSNDKKVFDDYVAYSYGWMLEAMPKIQRDRIEDYYYGSLYFTEEEYNRVKNAHYSNDLYQEIRKRKILPILGITDDETINSTKLTDIVPVGVLVNACWNYFSERQYFDLKREFVRTIIHNMKSDLLGSMGSLSDHYGNLDLFQRILDFIKEKADEIEFPLLTKDHLIRILESIKGDYKRYKEEPYMYFNVYAQNLNEEKEKNEFIEYYEKKFLKEKMEKELMDLKTMQGHSFSPKQ